MTNQDLEQILFDGLDLETGLEDRLWNAANRLRANSTLKASEYATPVLGLIFLKYASNKFELAKPLVEAEKQPWDEEEDIKKLYIAKCGFYLPEQSRYSYLLEGKYKEASKGTKTLQKAIIEAMEGIEEWNENLKDALPRNQYTAIDDDAVLENLLKEFSVIPVDAEGDLFGKIYEYFLGKFALAEGQKGGQFFTPTSIVKLIVEVIEPYKGKIFDPSCGSGGMFVQSAKFIKRHQHQANNLSIYGQERTGDTVDLAKMNLAVNGLNGDIKNVNSYYDDPFEIDKFINENGHGEFDYVMANPPFNVSDVVEEKITNATRFNFYGLPAKPSKSTSTNKNKQKLTTIGNANYLWANLFGSSLNKKGRAGFVMANSASDARGVEQEVRENIIKKGMVDVIVAVSSNFFISVTLPITLWFFDKGKPAHRKDKTLFIDARNIYTQVNRAIRTFTQSQLFDIAAIVWLYRDEKEKYDALIQLYKDALTRWENGTIQNPKNESRPFDGIEAATNDLVIALADLHDALKQWYETVNPLLEKEGIDQTVETQTTTEDGKEKTTTISFAEKLNGINEGDIIAGYKTLSDLTTFAERNLKIKKDKTFSDLKVKSLLKIATAAFEHHQFISERISYFKNHLAWHKKRFPKGGYADVDGLCKIADLADIEEQNYSLNAGRYVGVALEEDNLTAEEFKAEMMELHQQLLKLNKEAAGLEELINVNLKEVF
jgi:type I restriction enzyme M protein